MGLRASFWLEEVGRLIENTSAKLFFARSKFCLGMTKDLYSSSAFVSTQPNTNHDVWNSSHFSRELYDRLNEIGFFHPISFTCPSLALSFHSPLFLPFRCRCSELLVLFSPGEELLQRVSNSAANLNYIAILTGIPSALDSSFGHRVHSECQRRITEWRNRVLFDDVF